MNENWVLIWKTAMMQTHENTNQTTTLPDKSPPSVSAANRIVQRKCACSGTAGVTGKCADCSTKNLSLANAGVQRTFAGVAQRRLAISQPHDTYEQEADRVAEEVMKAPAQTEDVARKISRPVIQRMCTDCEEEELQRQAEDEETEEEQLVQGKSESGPTGEVSEEQSARIEDIKSGGESLPSSSLNFFEQRFGHDFSGVRVHADDRAVQSAKAIHAQAYTSGQHIVFGAGHYSPETQSGQRLLAHELTHVVQQTGERRLMRQEEETAPETDTETSSETSGDAEAAGLILPGYIPFSPEISSGFPGPLAGESEGPSEESAEVSRAPAADSADSRSPEEQAKSEAPYETGIAPENLAADLSHGHKLDDGVRGAMESRYGHSLDHVRIHADARADNLCQRFEAKAFAFDNHIAFRKGFYQPRTTQGEHLLRHEVTHVLHSPTVHRAVFRAPCTTNCPAAGAPSFAPFTSTSVNCYGYASNLPPSGFIDPGEKSGTADAVRQKTIRRKASPTVAELRSILPYFTPASMKTNAEADLGTALSSDCTACCTSPKRKVISVVTDNATRFARIAGVPILMAMVSPTQFWDHHWYRKDADRSWSHKRGGSPARQDDAGGTTPICNPCNASRTYTSPNVDYTNVVGSWCI